VAPPVGVVRIRDPSGAAVPPLVAQRHRGRSIDVLQAAAGDLEGALKTPSLAVIDTHLAGGASSGGFTFHDRVTRRRRNRSARMTNRVTV
jgi:hypothetical protein